METGFRAFWHRVGEELGWRGFVIAVPIAIAAIPLQRGGYVAGSTPVWLMVASVMAAMAGTAAVFVALPGAVTGWRLWVRSAVELFLIAAVLYIIGWGPTLVLGFAVAAMDQYETAGLKAEHPLIVLSIVAIGLGQLAYALGLLETLVPFPLVNGLALLAATGIAAVIHLQARPVTGRERARAELERSERRFRELVQHAQDAIIVFRPDHTDFLYASPALARILGDDADDPQLRERVHPEDRERLVTIFRSDGSFAGQEGWQELRVRHADGTWHNLEVSITDLRHDPAVDGLVANVRDVTERRLFEQQLSYQAYHDGLTRLPNRLQFVERLNGALERAQGTESAIAVLFLDVDRFKLVNDSLGHEVGDRLLAEIAARLRATLRPGDLVARFGGDEFTVLLEDVHSAGDAIVVAERVLDAFRAPIAIGGRELHTSTSVGIAVSAVGEADVDAGDLLREADLAMYLAKERGRGRWELFDSHTAPEVVERLELETGIRRAIERRELVVHFQPEVALDGTGVVSFEALVRWQHPTRGLLYPGVFIPVAEESSLIIELDRYVMREALRQARIWNQHFTARPVRASVNVSPRFLRQVEVVDDVRSILAEVDAEPGWLQLEITERTAVIPDDRTLHTLRALRSLGIAVAIDDFGTGYSSLAYLRELPADVLKLDQSFVADVSNGPAQLAIVQAVITMGHALGIRVTAEGVEHPAQLAELRSLGCDTAQGFHWSAAVPPGSVRSLLEQLGGTRTVRPADDATRPVTSADQA